MHPDHVLTQNTRVLTAVGTQTPQSSPSLHFSATLQGQDLPQSENSYHFLPPVLPPVEAEVILNVPQMQLHSANPPTVPAQVTTTPTCQPQQNMEILQPTQEPSQDHEPTRNDRHTPDQYHEPAIECHGIPVIAQSVEQEPTFTATPVSQTRLAEICESVKKSREADAQQSNHTNPQLGEMVIIQHDNELYEAKAYIQPLVFMKLM